MLQIEKVIKLLDDYHFDAFREYVKNINIRSYYPLVLIDCLNRSIEVKQSTEELCKKIYVDDDPKSPKTHKKFFQLAHYTFKLTHFLSRNYPSYLLSNLNKIQRLINKGDLKKANLYLEALIDISTKIENFDCLIMALNIKALQGELQENIKEVIKLYTQQAEIIEYRRIINQLYLYRQEQFSVKSKPKTSTDIEVILTYFKPYFDSKSLVVSALSQYFYLHGLNFFNAETFFDKTTLQQIENLEKLLENNSYLLFPYLEDLDYRVNYLKLRALIQNIDDSRVIASASKILENAETTYFWNSFTNKPEFFSIAIQASYLFSNYNIAFKHNFSELLPKDVKEKIEIIKKRCQFHLDKQFSNDDMNSIVKYINLTAVYSGLLTIGNQADNKEAIRILQNLLYTYQQIPFHAYIDPIFGVMISAYFNLQDYKELENCYRRYRKITDKKVVNPENNFTIHVFFYVSKWLSTNRKQYIKKLQRLIEDTHKQIRNQKLLQDMNEYYDLNLVLS